jgi:D-hydroxyproline dehydrogenase subunit beta
LVLPDDDVHVEMSRASLEVYRRVAAEAPLDVRLDAEPAGTVLAAMNARESRDAEAMVARAERHGIEVLDISGPGDIRDHEPGLTRNVAAAWLLADGYRLDPGALTVALALAAGALGAEVRHHLHVRGLSMQGDRVRGVVTDDGVVDADTTVVAAGPWSSTLLEQAGVHLPIVGARGWLVRIDPVEPDLITHLVAAPGPHAALREGEPGLSPTAADVAAEGTPGSEVGALLTPARDGLAVVVGSTRQLAITPEPSEHDVVGRLVRAAIDLVPGVSEARVRSSWWGVRPLTPDERPIVGRVADGLHVATGHGSEGVILGAGTAQLVASQIAGESPPFDDAPYDPGRFATGR